MVDAVSGNNLILGLAAGFHYGDLRPFLVSLERSGFAGSCVLFVSSTTRDIPRIESYGVRCSPFCRPSELDHVPYNAYRYFLYKDYLLNSGRNFDAILLTDTRDVVFQSDPFAFAWGRGLNVTLEDRFLRIGDCPYMTRWVTHHLGAQALEKLQEHRISCSGTSLGDQAAILNYLEQMTRLLVPFSPERGVAGYDQGVHNHLLHDGSLPEVTLHDNSGPILTLGQQKEPPLQDSADNVLNDKGEPAVIVHQYDRHMNFFQKIRDRFK